MRKPGTRLRQSRNDLKEKKRLLEIERGSVRPHSVQNSLWKGIWTCRKTDCLNFKRRIKSRLPFAGIIRSSPYSPRFQDKG